MSEPGPFDFNAKLDALFASECHQMDDHDPPPCPKCERMKAEVRLAHEVYVLALDLVKFSKSI